MGMMQTYHLNNKFGNDHGMQCHVIKPGQVEIIMYVQEKHMATITVAHGGIIAALMDAALSLAALSLFDNENKYISTVEFKINYVKSAAQGDKLRSCGTVIKQGNRVLVARGEIFNENNETIAFAQGTLMPYDAK